MSTLQAFHDFSNSLTDFREAKNGNRDFPAKIRYTFGEKVLKERLRVTLFLNGSQAGNVYITEGEDITAKAVHLEFKPRFQEYSINTEGALVIKGTNSLVIGDYEVTILPVPEEIELPEEEEGDEDGENDPEAEGSTPDPDTH